jgi:uncharacterized protein (TIGR02145 family)
MIYKVRPGETLSDVVLNATGSIQNMSAILVANGFTSWSQVLFTGQSITIPDDIEIQYNNQYVLSSYPAKNGSVQPNLATSISDFINTFVSKSFSKSLDESLSLSEGTLMDLVSDVDGNTYKLITIGSKQWFVSSLKTTKYADGSSINNITDADTWKTDTGGAYCFYDNNSTYKTPYGALYNWYAVNNVKGLAPTGFRVATNDDFNDLISYLGGSKIAGGKLKQTGTAYWLSPNTGATDEIGFKAYPAGYRSFASGGFNSRLFEVNFWTSTAYSVSRAYRFNLQYNTAATFSDYNNYNYGFSVRCVRDI